MKPLIILLAIFMLLGELDEIDYQVVGYGEDIKQYALVREMKNGNEFIKPCTDCKCNITLTDNNHKKQVNNKGMTEKTTGLFTFLCSSQIPPGPYAFLANCTSASLGSGIVLSDLLVKDNSIITDDVGLPSCEAYKVCIPVIGRAYLNCFPDAIFCLKDSLWTALEKIWTPLVKLTDFIINIDLKTRLEGSLITLITAIGMIPFLIFAVPVILIGPFIILFFMLIELYAIGYTVFSAKPQNGFEWVTKWLGAHVKIVVAIKDIVAHWI